MPDDAIDAYFVCGGRYHDIDYARLQLLTLLGEHERIRTRDRRGLPRHRESVAAQRLPA